MRSHVGVLALAAVGTFAFFGAITGCRGVLGIDDLDVNADGGTTTTDAAGDTTTADAPVSGDSSTADAAPEDCAASNDCPKCCHQAAGAMAGFSLLWAAAKTSGCVCGGAPCQTECAADVCAGTTSQPKMGCPECIDMQLRMAGPACTNVKPGCGSNGACEAALACITSCK